MPTRIFSTTAGGSGGGGAAITIEDEGVALTTAVTSIDFVGSGVSASAVGNDVTVNISGGGSGDSFTTINCPAGTDPVADSATDTLNLTSSGSTVTITGDSSTDTVNFDIANDAVTNAKLANMATQTFKGRTTGGTGDPEDLTVTQATALLNAVVGDSGSGGTKGLVPAPAAGDAAAGKFLKADGTFAVPAGGGSSVIVQDEGSAVNTATTLNFVGSGVTATDAGSGVATITISGGGGGGGDSFTTIACTAGTNPVADSATDTLTLASSDGTIVTTGNSGTDTVDFSARVATGSVSGVVSTSAQTLAGRKTLSGGVTLGASGNPAVSALSDGASIAVDASLGNHFRVTIAGNRTLSNPTNAVDGQRMVFEIIQDGTGGRTLALDTKFALGSDIFETTLSTTASKRDFIGCIYNSTADKFYVVSFVKGY